MKKLKIIAMLSALIILLSGCQLSSFDTETLLTAPLMNPQDQEMRKAISDAIGTSFEPVYPKSGSYQTAITSIDITGDGKNEAFCFFTPSGEQNVNFMVLQNQNGKWMSIGHSKSQAMSVERIAFCDLTKDGKQEVIIGWQYLSGEENAIEIFSLTEDANIKSEYTGMYNDFITFDSYLAIISKNSTAKTASAALVGANGKAISAINTLSLNNSIVGFTKIQTSLYNGSTTLIYIDEQLESLMYTTEVLVLSKKDKVTLSKINLENMPMRSKAFVCIDADNDAVLDLPIEKELPAYTRNGTEERLSYVDWYSITETEPKFIKSTYSSINEPFYIELKPEWIGEITIEKNEINERMIHFYTLENKRDMFSIRVFSRQEYTDSAEKNNWIEIASSGENVYTYRQDNFNPEDKFYTEADTLSELFVVLS